MQRSPDAVPLWKSVAARHHADDRDRRAADANDAADGVCRAGQLVFPEVVSDHHDLFCVAPSSASSSVRPINAGTRVSAKVDAVTLATVSG